MGNINGINAFERMLVRIRLAKADKQDQNVEITRDDRKALAEAIKSKDPKALEQYLQNQDAQIRGAMGLALKGTVNDIARAREIAAVFANDLDPDGKPVDVEKLARYICSADVERIEKGQVAFAEDVQNIVNTNTFADTEKLFAGGFTDMLDSLQTAPHIA